MRKINVCGRTYWATDDGVLIADPANKKMTVGEHHRTGINYGDNVNSCDRLAMAYSCKRDDA